MRTLPLASAGLAVVLGAGHAYADSGGWKRKACQVIDIPPVTPTFPWEIARPVGGAPTGSGPLASMVTDPPG